MTVTRPEKWDVEADGYVVSVEVERNKTEGDAITVSQDDDLLWLSPVAARELVSALNSALEVVEADEP